MQACPQNTKDRRSSCFHAYEFGLDLLIPFAVMIGVAVFLFRSYDLKLYSDPVSWYMFARDFADQCVSRQLPYGFPLLIAAAMKCVGPIDALLLNIPLLVLLVGVLYFYIRSHLDLQPKCMNTAAATLAIVYFVAVNGKMLLYLTSPYRDPLSFLFVLLACLALILGIGTSRLLVLSALSGASLALACSVRETSVLTGLPMALFMIMSTYRRTRSIPWKAGILFVVCFLVFCLPLLVQNVVISGHALVPAQAAESFASQGSITPGVSARFFDETSPRLAGYAVDHFGWPGLLLFFLGAVAGVRRRNFAVFLLSLPAVLLYAVFYGSYVSLFHRYVFVIDFFAFAVIGYGIAWLLAFAARRIPGQSAQRYVCAGVTGCGLVAFVLMISTLSRPKVQPFRTDDVVRLKAELERRIPPAARVLGDRPMAEIAKCLLDNETDVVRFLSQHNTLRDPGLPGVIYALSREGKPLYLVYSSDACKQYMARICDVVGVDQLCASDFSLTSHLGSDTIHIARLVPWTARRLAKSASLSGESPWLLRMEMGHLSLYPRTNTVVSVGGGRWSAPLHDGVNMLVMEDLPPGTVDIVVSSDGPLPQDPVMRAAGVQEILLRFDGSVVFDRYAQFFSDSFAQSLHGKYPEISDSGRVMLPAFGGPRGYYVVIAQAGLSSTSSRDSSRLSIADHTSVVFDDMIAANDDRPGGSWRRVVAVTTPDPRQPDTISLRWEIDPDPAKTRRLVIKSIRCFHVEPRETFSLQVGKDDEHGIWGGLYHAERSGASGPWHWRWTQGHAKLGVFIIPPRGDAVLDVTYLAGNRPSRLGAPSVRFVFNGTPLSGTCSPQSVPPYSRNRVRCVLPYGLITNEVNRLEIVTDTWIPRNEGVGGDSRTLGIMLESVSVRPQS